MLTSEQVCRLGYTALRIAFSPSSVSQALSDAISAAPAAQQDDLLLQFLRAKQSELTTVMIAVGRTSSSAFACADGLCIKCALVSALVASLFSWQWFPVPAYTGKVAMLCALLHSLMGLAIASQQSVALSRASLHPRCADLVKRILLVPPSSANARKNPVSWTHIAWQIPTMLLGNSIVFLLVGFSIVIYSAARAAADWGEETKVALGFTISFLFIVACYLTSWALVEWRIQEALTII